MDETDASISGGRKMVLANLYDEPYIANQILDMTTDWVTLSKELGSLAEDGSESANTSLAFDALDMILGDEWVENTVDHIVSFKRGSELAMLSLKSLRSTKALRYAYRIYTSSEGERAERAVWLIKHLCHPGSLGWIEEFLNDSNVIGCGLGVLDQLLWTAQIEFDEKANALLELAHKNSNGGLSDRIAFIRQYLNERSERQAL